MLLIKYQICFFWVYCGEVKMVRSCNKRLTDSLLNVEHDFLSNEVV